jgi:TolB-like protein
MRVVFLIAVFFTVFQQVFAAGQTVAVLPSDGVLSQDELEFLTDKAQEIAVRVLPKDNFEVFPQEVVIKRLGGADSYMKECKESSCIVDLGRKASVDYVAQCRFGKLGSDLRITFELYNVRTSGLIDKFSETEKSTAGLLAIMEKKIPDGFMKIPGAVSKTKTVLPSVIGGISGLQSGADDEFDVERLYLTNFATEPSGAILSFNGMPAANCPKTPCSVELAEGSVRIIAALDQYETADTTVSIRQNSQTVSIRLKANFGVLEIKPAYSEGIGKNESWSLTINGKAASSWENRLSPGRHSVKLGHSCYEDISFDVGINKDSTEVFDMESHAKLKRGGLSLSAEKDGSPVSEPVFVNGIHAGETPFSGSLAVCSDIEIGAGKEKVDVRLEHKQAVRHMHKVQTGETFTDEQPIYEPPAYEPPSNTRQIVNLEDKAQEKIDPKVEMEKPSNKSFWLALAFDIAGAAFVYYGYEMDKEVVRRYEDYASLGSGTTKWKFDDTRANIENAKTKRNVSYIWGSIFLATGIGVHIWF